MGALRDPRDGTYMNKNQKVLVTGGAGYIGSHTCVALAAAGISTVVLDNFCNSRRSVVVRMAQIIGEPVDFVEGDVRDEATLDRVFAAYDIGAVMHFAGRKAVGESVLEPLGYYDSNVCGSITLLRAMQRERVRTLVFSSSATVYRESAEQPLREGFPLGASSPYGWSKLMMEQVLADADAAQPGQWRIARLRYFNPVGAHESGLIGEDPQDVPNNLMPYVAQVAAGKREWLNIYGSDYPTIDGTGVRDYIHVCDVADGHVAALRHLYDHPGLLTLNLGTGKPVSVLEMVRAFERASGCNVPVKMVARRAGDLSQFWADPSLAETVLGWSARHGTDRMCEDAWRWQHGVARTL